MIIIPPHTKSVIPPGFIDFTSSSFDSILFPDSVGTPTKTILVNGIQKRASHLPDLIPFISLITEKCDIQAIHLIIALIYVQRFRKSLPEEYNAEPEAAHRIFVASLLVASKYVEDKSISAKQIVRATGDVWSIKEITRMELAFLRFLHWNLYVSREEIHRFLLELGFDPHSILSDVPSPILSDDTLGG
ncbi:hypothetical protein BDB01DRAFT_844279 [Pilobolus umbonatus]|nr:hypothetical protein BDB01DRAFT_844279 [Pilobolus umbonatus]